MPDTVDISLPVDAEVAQGLANPVRREAAGLVLSALLRGAGAAAAVADAVAAVKKEAHARGLTDEDVDAELAAWRHEPRT